MCVWKKRGAFPLPPLFFIECECVFARVKKRERECVCRVGAWGGHTFLIKIKKRGKKNNPLFQKNYSANSPSSPSPSPRSSAATAPSASAGPNAR